MRGKLALAAAATVVVAVAVTMGALAAGGRPASGAVEAGAPTAESSWFVRLTGWTSGSSAAQAGGPASAEPAPGTPAAEAAAHAAAAAPAAPAALVAAPDGSGRLVEAPAGLAGRSAARKGSPAVVDWQRVPVLARVSDLGKQLAGPTMRGLASARDSLDPCFEAEKRALAAGRQPPFDPADPPSGPAVLVLDLETTAGGLRIVNADVDSLGTSTAELATCAVQILSGWKIDAPGASAGTRYRLRHLLQ